MPFNQASRQLTSSFARSESRYDLLYLESVYFYTGGARLISLPSVKRHEMLHASRDIGVCTTSTPDLCVLQEMDGSFYDVHDRRYFFYIRLLRRTEFANCQLSLHGA